MSSEVTLWSSFKGERMCLLPFANIGYEKRLFPSGNNRLKIWCSDKIPTGEFAFNEKSHFTFFV